LWRADTSDALYAVGAGVATSPPTAGVTRAAGGSGASYVGSELDLLLNWQLNRHVSGYLGYSHFFAGDFISATGGGIARWSIEHPYIVLAFYLGVAVLSVLVIFFQMPRRMMPYVESPIVGVVSMMPGLSAEEIAGLREHGVI